MRYTNLERDRLEDEELARLEAEYRKRYGQEANIEEDPKVEKPITSDDKTDWKKRYSDLQSHADKKENDRKLALEAKEQEVSALKQKLAEFERQGDGLDLPETVDQMREWIEKYPDLSRIIKAMIREDTKFVEENVHALKADLEKDREEILKQRAFAKVLKVHEDFAELVQSDDFKEWVADQPRKRGRIGQGIFDAMNGLDADSAIEAVNMYKNDKKPVKTEKDKEKELVRGVHTSRSAGPPKNDGKPTFLESQIEAMSIRQYEAMETQIDEARREGRITYDLSGAAR